MSAASALRMLAVLVLAVLISLALLLLVTYRMLPRDLVPWYWGEMVIKGQTPAGLVQEWFGRNPPDLVRDLAVAWHRARPLAWWWLPVLFLAVRWAVLRLSSRRRSQPPPRRR